MAKKKITIDDVRSEIETYMIERLAELDDYISDTYEIDCWDSCLDGAVWNDTLKTITAMYVDAIVNDRDWGGLERRYKLDIDINTVLERRAKQRQIKQLEREVKELS